MLRESSAAYSSKALSSGTVFTLAVESGGQVMYPLEMASPPSVGAPSERRRLNLTLGADSDEDGLPDAWEEAQLHQAGIAPRENGWDLSLIDKDGDFDKDGVSNYLEYLAGTYAADAASTLELKIKEKLPEAARLEFYAIYGKTYTLQSSTDLSTWADVSFSLTTSATAFALTGDFLSGLGEAWAEAPPVAAGLSNYVTSVVRSSLKLQGMIAGYALQLSGLAESSKAALLDAEAADLEAEAQSYIDDYNFDTTKQQHVVEFEWLYDQVLSTAYEMTRRLSKLQKATEQVSRLYAEANHILSERETFRQRAASVIQGYRTRDLVYRDFRNEELSQYKSLFDLAQTYAYFAAKAYDYETGLLDSPEGEAYINQIVGTYSIGDWNGENPIQSGSGDAGPASALSGLRDDWEVAEGRLGLNNPDRNGTLFSLRQELFRIRADQPTADDDLLWKQVLQQHIMSNVLNDPDVAIYANNVRKSNGSAVTGIVIPFSTTIEPGLNFFGWPLAAGDHAFSQSNFATKIHSSGLVLSGYVGMDPYAIGTPGAGGPASTAPNAMSATPYAYLIPAGVDSMRAPPLGDTNVIRSWTVKDQAIPLPKNLGAIGFSSTQFFTPSGSINEQLWITRKHPAFRLVNDPVHFYSTMPAEFTNSRLIGRSVWNSQWKIIIPAYTLLNDEQAGLDRFTQNVRNIKLFLRTYSNSGN